MKICYNLNQMKNDQFQRLAFGLFDFLGNRDPIPAFAQADPKEIRQGAHNLDDLIGLVSLRHPNNRIEGVIEKMRVDLGLQRS